jgi:3-oxoacyl-[acyl-carrier-protein] synthase-3
VKPFDVPSVWMIGVGAALPATSVPNTAFAHLDTSDAWIRQRTGITQRYIASPSETTATLAASAAHTALLDAGCTPAAVDYIVVATTTPDNTFPATAALVQHMIGVPHGPAFDIQAVCAGFLFALVQAANALQLGQARTALVIGADTLSRIIDWEDRETCVLFGDGAGAVVLTNVPPGDAAAGARPTPQLITHVLHTEGRLADILSTSGGVSRHNSQGPGYIRMQGKDVFRHACEKMAASVVEVCTRGGITCADIDWLIPHQANQRILEAVARQLDIPSTRCVSTVAHHANTSAASIPIALSHTYAQFQTGQHVVMTALGAGLSWGAALWKW